MMLLAILLCSLSPETVSFRSGDITLQGVIYKPQGAGPFPAILYNHGSDRDPQRGFDALAEVFVYRGYVFFGPFRRGQGLSAKAGPYVMDEVDHAWFWNRGETLVRLLEGDQLADQLAALEWLKAQPFVAKDRIAAAGNSFGGIETVLGAEHGGYCAAIDSAGGAQTWAHASELRERMKLAVRNARVPIFFFQAENDWNLAPSRELSAEMKSAGREFELKIYPAFGTTPQQGHSFGYYGSATWAGDVFAFLAGHCKG